MFTQKKTKKCRVDIKTLNNIWLNTSDTVSFTNKIKMKNTEAKTAVSKTPLKYYNLRELF